MLDTVVRGGVVVTPTGTGRFDVAIQDGRIAAVGAPGTFTQDVANIVEADGALVIPGGIDPHVHTNWPIPAKDGTVTHSASPQHIGRAALFGGTTTLVDFAVADCTPETEIADAIEAKQKEWADAETDYSFHVL
ncbi:MAG: dihydropyrimidinase, partial [Acidimicrobiia bacterium]|nr:dihydropyrimidinase [Acidimicrobiia bacterium]